MARDKQILKQKLNLLYKHISQIHEYNNFDSHISCNIIIQTQKNYTFLQVINKIIFLKYYSYTWVIALFALSTLLYKCLLLFEGDVFLDDCLSSTCSNST